MRAVRYKSAVIMLLLILAAGFAVFRWWQGPLLSGYSINSMPLVQTVVATGRVVTVSRTQVGSEITGVVLKRLVQEGDRVTRGDLLLVLRSDELTAQVRQAEAALNELMSSTRPQASVDLANTQVQLAQASRELQRRRILAKDSVISKEELEQSEKAESLARNNVESARLKALALAPGKAEEIVLRERLVALQAQLAKTQVSSEVTGIVLTRNVEPGDLVQPSMTLFTIALDGNTEIRVPLDERNLPRLALQQNASVIADAYPDRPFPAQINFIAPSIDPERGTVEVRLTVDPVPDFLRQDMTVSVNIETDQRAHTRVIPNDALGNVQGNKAIVLLLRDGKIHRQTVTLGLRGLAMSEVVSGLQDGEQVLADAVSPLKDGTRARLTLQKISAAEPSNNTDSKNELPVKFD
ncbi:efflux transporter periplasmic adaptor subunit [Acinetobacter harbinensis]|uniref:efflux RND transporter periplasmic adaptor subunit n=1 Tax=Acinetobacter harbinensis TaxID=1353941 RepID=UPI00057E5094|nr:efflux RND transporter periplasmic adaptor subunit [Acinetobacter harbinensis]KWQ04809.1 efflux transporter periplasmic adaptor subunit [Acinetobacter harbinensis]